MMEVEGDAQVDMRDDDLPDALPPPPQSPLGQSASDLFTPENDGMPVSERLLRYGNGEEVPPEKRRLLDTPGRGDE